MAKIYFGKTVRYEGTEYPPNTTFEVKDTDLAALVKAGAEVLEEPKVDSVEELLKQFKPMTMQQLKEYAAEKEIDISAVSKKDDIIETIIDAVLEEQEKSEEE